MSYNKTGYKNKQVKISKYLKISQIKTSDIKQTTQRSD